MCYITDTSTAIDTWRVHEFLTYCIPVYKIFSGQLILTIVSRAGRYQKNDDDTVLI